MENDFWSKFFEYTANWPKPLQYILSEIIIVTGLFLSPLGVLFLINFYFFYKSPKKEFWQLLKPTCPAPKTIFLLMSALLFEAGLLLSFPMPWVIPLEKVETDIKLLQSAGPNVVLKIILTYLLLAFFEEIIFRSYILIEAKKRGVLLVIAAAMNLLFALWHSAFIPQLISGFVLIWLFLKYQSVFITTVYHFGTNLLLILLAVYGQKNNQLPFFQFLSSENRIFLGFALILIFIWPLLEIYKELFRTLSKEDYFFIRFIQKRGNHGTDKIS